MLCQWVEGKLWEKRIGDKERFWVFNFLQYEERREPRADLNPTTWSRKAG